MFQEWVITGGGDAPEAFLVRGMKVSEWVDYTVFRESMDFKLGEEGKVMVAKMCVLNWRNICDEDDNELDFKTEYLDLVDIKILAKVGEHVLTRLTEVSDEDEKRFKGYVRWSMWLSDEKNKSKRKEFDCKECILSKRYEAKRCGLTQDMRDLIVSSDQSDEDDEEASPSPSQKSSSDNLAKFKNRRTNKQTYHYNKVEEKKALKQSSDGFLLSGTKHFRFPECPVSWISPWMRTVADMMLYCEHKNLNFFEGGVENQYYKSYIIGRIVISEYNRIENEKHEERK